MGGGSGHQTDPHGRCGLMAAEYDNKGNPIMRTDDDGMATFLKNVVAFTSERIIALHVAEEHRGAARAYMAALATLGLDVQGLNGACEEGGLTDRLHRRNGEPADVVLPRIFGDDRMRVVHLSGWGSDPRRADGILAGLYPHVASRPNIRLVVTNNASPVPHMFTQAQPTAHPDAEGFACHVARTAGVERGMVDLQTLVRDDA